jgi:hypothetical protein
MKVLLTNPYAPDGRHFWSLTVGREYEVIGIEADNFRLMDDCGEPVLFDPICFEATDFQEPSFWINEFGEDGERYAYPPGWGVPGFFEAWHDQVEIIQSMFNAQLAVWYPLTAQSLKEKKSNPFKRSEES